MVVAKRAVVAREFFKSMNDVQSNKHAKLARSVYVHIPFCEHRCGYCNFALIANRDDLVPQFIKALAEELESVPQNLVIDTLFWGGGTPSSLSPDQIESVFEILGRRFTFASDMEFTVEVNPNDMNESCANAMKSIGVNRISFGVQSFRAPKLEFLERTHRPSDIATAVEHARTFSRSVSFDLIFGAGQETLENWQSDLECAIRLQPDHISTYGLTIEKGTQFWNRQQRGQSVSVDDERSADMYELAIDTLTHAGYQQYEISSFARPGHRCRHNQVYWNGKPYLAFGPGAASFDGKIRTRNHLSVTTYIKRIFKSGCAIDQREPLNDEMLLKERLIFGLRQIDGINMKQFESDTGRTPQEILDPMVWRRLIENDLMTIVEGYLRLTRRGILVSDSIFVDMI